MEQKKRVPKRRFAGFTDEWEDRKLGDIAEIVSGGTPSTNNPKYWDGDVDWYSPTEIGDHVYAYRSVKTITQLGLEKSSAKILPPAKTILFTSRAGIGDMAILQRPGATNQGFQSLVLKEGIDTYFIYSMGHLIKKYAEKNASGSTFLEISGKTLGNMLILVPSINEQQKTGDFFKKLDDMITIQQRKLEKTKVLKSAYLAEMFPTEGERVPKRRFAGFVDEWKRYKFSSLLDRSDGIRRGPFGSALKKDFFVLESDYVVYEQQNAIYDRYNTRYNITKEKYDELQKFRLSAGDFIMSGAGTIGRISRVPKGIKAGVINQALIRIKIVEAAIDSEFFLQWMRSEDMQRKLTEANPASAMVNLVPMSEVKEWEVLVPKRDEQQKIGDFFKKLDDLIANHQRKLEKLQALKQAYLHEMFV